MTKEMIKAIRLVNGFNPDLRVNLSYASADDLYDWIEANRIGIFGLRSDMCIKPELTSPEFDKYDRRIKAAVYAVINGKAR